jgi:hypothetical protein
MSKRLWQKLYFAEVYAETARIIGYAGTEPLAFWEAARGLADKHGKQKVLNAVYDLTRADRREASPPRYELNGPAREWCWQLLGPPPEKEDAFYRHPDGTPLARPAPEPPQHHTPAPGPQPEKPKRARMRSRAEGDIRSDDSKV